MRLTLWNCFVNFARALRARKRIYEDGGGARKQRWGGGRAPAQARFRRQRTWITRAASDSRVRTSPCPEIRILLAKWEMKMADICDVCDGSAKVA